MTAYAAVVSLMNTMKNIQIHPRLSIAFDNKQIEFLFEKLGFLLHHIKCNSHGGSREEELERLIARAAHAAEDIIESHIVDQIRGAGPISLLHLRSVLTTFDSPMKEVMEFEKEKASNNTVELIGSADELIQQPVERIWRKNTRMIGFEEELNQLLEMLIGQESSRQIIPIVGMGGIGKTTLARNAYENLTSKDHFDIRAWATISQNYNVREIVLQLLCIKSKSAADTGTEEELGLKLHERLCGRRYLIILDDLWSVEAWEKIMFVFPDNSNRSRVVVTTRLSNMATYFASSCLAMNFLEEDKSWKLFHEKAFGQQGCPPELEEIGMEIAKKCKGLPLSITVIGGFLGKSSMKKKYWEKIAKDINSVLSSGEDDHEHCSNILATSYTYLPAHLKPCFLYMAVFREDEEIRVSRLIKLWVSEGFLEPNENQTLEEIAEGYVNDLVDRNLIIAVSEVSGKIRTCNVHDLLRDLCLRICEKEKFLRVVHPFNFPQDMSSDRRLVLPGGIPDPTEDDGYYNYNEDFGALQSASLARSVISLTGQLNFEHRLLRVLDKVNWSLQFTEQLNLRYISFDINLNSDLYERIEINHLPMWNSQTFIAKDIKSISDLYERIEINHLPMWNFQTFIAKDTNEAYYAPLEIWEMQQLRHLDVNRLYLPDPELGGLVLRNLQTLKGVVNLRLNAEVCRRIPNVTTLGIRLYDRYHCLDNLRQLHKLESLRLSFHCVELEPNPHGLVRKLLFPSALRKLTLVFCNLHWEDLTLIGCCPNLEVLKLLGGRVIGSEWSPVEGQFGCLKMLKIKTGQNHLIRWNADCTHFPVLEKLFLGRLQSLEEIPSSIGDIPTLRHICLIHPTDSTALSALRILQDQLDNSGYEVLQVEVIFSDQARLEGFKKLMMESESFTCTNVQLTVNYYNS